MVAGRIHDGKPCPYCGEQLKAFKTRAGRLGRRHPTADHVFPKSKGGTVKIIVCRECNELKRNMTPDQWLVWLTRNKPHRVKVVRDLIKEVLK